MEIETLVLAGARGGTLAAGREQRALGRRAVDVHAPKDAGRPVGYGHARMEVVDLLPPAPRSILDVGCSDGATGRELRRRHSGLRLVGLDISEDAVRAAQASYDRALVCDLDSPTALDALGEERFDAIIAPDVLEHLRDPAMALSSLVRRLEPNGVLVVSLPNIQHLAGLLTIAAGRFPREEAGLFDKTHLRWFTRQEAEGLFRSCGLSVTGYRRILKLSLKRRARVLWPVLGLAGDLFASQMVFRLKREFPRIVAGGLA